MSVRKVFSIALITIVVVTIFVLPALGAKLKMEEIPVLNWNFEMLGEAEDTSSVLGKMAPHWNAGSAFAEGCFAGLSDEVVYDGKLSMKLIDESNTGQVFLMSDKIPAEAGQQYCVTAQVFNAKESPNGLILYITWWSEDGQRLSDSAFTESAKRGQWEEVSAIGAAPKDTKYISIWVVTGKSPKVKGYVDAIKLFIISR